MTIPMTDTDRYAFDTVIYINEMVWEIFKQINRFKFTRDKISFLAAFRFYKIDYKLTNDKYQQSSTTNRLNQWN